MTEKEEKALKILRDFIEEHDICCLEDVMQRESVYDECPNLVVMLVEAILDIE